MIRINLAKAPGGTPSKKAVREDKAGGDKPALAAGPFFLTLFLILAAVGGIYFFATNIKAARDQQPVSVPLPPAVPREGVPAPKPSSNVRTNMAEDVVREVGDSKAEVKSEDVVKGVVKGASKGEDRSVAAGEVKGEDKGAAKGKAKVEDKGEVKSESRELVRLDAPYAEMPVAERVNYEALFARNVFDMVSRCTPPGIGFRSLEVEGFQTVYASGAGLSRQMVQEMFAAFKSERGELMPKPLSYIKDDDKSNFMFVITYKPRFGLNVSDPFQALDHIGFKEGIPQHLKSFSRLAGANNFKVSAQPVQVSVEKAGGYRRVVYKASGMSTYRDFHKFVLALYGERVPCAFKKISMKPVRDEEVRVDVEILFTVKE